MYRDISVGKNMDKKGISGDVSGMHRARARGRAWEFGALVWGCLFVEFRVLGVWCVEFKVCSCGPTQQ